MSVKPLEYKPVCSVCFDLGVEGIDQQKEPFTSEELLESSTRGCNGCMFLVHVVSTSLSKLYELLEPFAFVSSLELYVGLDLGGPAPLAIVCNPKDRAWRSDPIALEIYRHLETTNLWPAVGLGREISGSTSSEEAFGLAKSWLDECDVQHTECSEDEDSPPPKRLIHVGDNVSSPRIVEDLSAPVAYAALSYCWGVAQPVVITNRTLPLWKIKLPLETLPQTMKDAVLICRRLRITWLWIDALCIIQDSAEDWQEQSAQMGSVYANSYVRIAAEIGRDSYSGCLSTPEKSKISSMEIKCNGVDRHQTSVWVREGRTQMPGTTGHISDARFSRSSRSWYGESEVLARRGWVFQEQVLSRRTLYFNPEEISWSCPAARKCECKVFIRERRDRDTAWRHLKQASNSGCSPPSSASTPTTVGYATWQGIVEEYSWRELSLYSDRLEALSGVAAVMRSHLKDDYILGLWRENLIESLTWSVNPFKPSRRIPASSRTAVAATAGSDSGNLMMKQVSDARLSLYAPSWSWASVTGSVLFYSWITDGHVLEQKSVIKGVEYAISGRNPYGAGQGVLLVDGLVVPISRSFPWTTWDNDAVDQHDGLVRLLGLQDTCDPNTKASLFFMPDVRGEDETELSGTDGFSFLVLSRFVSGGDSENSYEVAVKGLLLEAVHDGSDTYRRVGFIRVEPDRGFHSSRPIEAAGTTKRLRIV